MLEESVKSGQSPTSPGLSARPANPVPLPSQPHTHTQTHTPHTQTPILLSNFSNEVAFLGSPASSQNKTSTSISSRTLSFPSLRPLTFVSLLYKLNYHLYYLRALYLPIFLLTEIYLQPTNAPPNQYSQGLLWSLVDTHSVGKSQALLSIPLLTLTFLAKVTDTLISCSSSQTINKFVFAISSHFSHFHASHWWFLHLKWPQL